MAFRIARPTCRRKAKINFVLTNFPRLPARLSTMARATSLRLVSPDMNELERQLIEAIQLFEPRILRHTLQVKATVERHLISFEIRGDLWANPVPEHLFINTKIDLETGQTLFWEIVQMDERLLEHYNAELRHLREMTGEFAREFPEIARVALPLTRMPRRLSRSLRRASPGGFRLAGGQNSRQMDAEFPRFTQSLIETVYPHYLRQFRRWRSSALILTNRSRPWLKGSSFHAALPCAVK